MKIELSNPTTVKITWVYNDAATEAEIVRRLHTVPGIEGRGRCFWANAVHTARLMELFGRASFDYAAIAAGDRLGHAFYAMLVRFDLDLVTGPENGLVAVGDGVSPLIQSLVDERAPALRIAMRYPRAAPKPKPEPPVPLPQGPLTVDDANFEGWFKAAQTTAQRLDGDKTQYGKRRWKGKMKQGELGI